MNTQLDNIARVARDLLAQGAEEVEIIGKGTKVKCRRIGYMSQSNPTGTTQIVNVNTQAMAVSSANIDIQFTVLLQELKEIYKDNPKLIELELKIKEIESELKKKSPDKSILSKLLTWISDIDWDTYLRIIPIILQRFS
jgi:hypothetical protein